MQVEGVNISYHDMEPGRVDPIDTRNLSESGPCHLQQIRSFSWVLIFPLSNPPVVAQAIHGSFAVDHNVLAVFEKQEFFVNAFVPIFFRLGFNRPVLPVLGGQKSSVNGKWYVSQVVQINWAWRERVTLWHDHSSIIVVKGLSKSKAVPQSLLVLLDDLQRGYFVFVWNSATVQNVVGLSWIDESV